MKLFLSFFSALLCFKLQARFNSPYSLLLTPKKDTDKIREFFTPHWKLNTKALEQLIKNHILAQAQVFEDEKKTSQEFSMKVAAVHNKNCRTVIRKLNRFEEYSKWISYIESSSYDDKNKYLRVIASHTLLPYKMSVHVIVERPKKAGSYSFLFPIGIFAGLKGKFIIEEVAGRCVIFAKSHWKGQHTGLRPMLIELFSETLAHLGAKTLIRKSQM